MSHVHDFASPAPANYFDAVSGEASPAFSPAFTNASPGVAYDYSAMSASPSYSAGVAEAGPMGAPQSGFGNGYLAQSPGYAPSANGGFTAANQAYSPTSPAM